MRASLKAPDWEDVIVNNMLRSASSAAILMGLAGVAPAWGPHAAEGQEELGYDPFMGNPLGRTFKLGIKKAF